MILKCLCRSQFNNGDPPRNQGTGRKDKKKGSRGKVKLRASNAQEPSCVDNWVNPRSSVPVPTNVGKRRVSANGKSSGCWYTGTDGRKVAEIETYVLFNLLFSLIPCLLDD